MKARSHAADYYRRILSTQPHGFKRLDPVVAIAHYHREQEIPNVSGSAGHWYCVIVGATRRCTIRSDGRRQILDLMLPQDFFFVSDSRDDTIEAAAEDTVLASYPGARIEQLAELDPVFARELRAVALESLTRSQNQLQIVGGTTALEKVSSFLLSLDGRRCEKTSGQVELPVSRYDIADYLAVSVETVCRAMTDLQHRGLISLTGTRTVRIVNRALLQDLRRTRNGVENPAWREQNSVAHLGENPSPALGEARSVSPD